MASRAEWNRKRNERESVERKQLQAAILWLSEPTPIGRWSKVKVVGVSADAPQSLIAEYFPAKVRA
jgi:hypothetical protein